MLKIIQKKADYRVGYLLKVIPVCGNERRQFGHAQRTETGAYTMTL
ncbi:hypothetical protein AB8970_06895 [Yersinia enterocolitica]|nr:hypothetical protein [Yersinia enterocolitica]HEN3603772.1 hypothetical protein [Yersinia enterocolitica]HEN3612588.1 hypothetical protein [Yersinia enterocolitica]HEN3620606.1 hypothetical protein [Yersinia enterocolitica]HEN3646578.1 hypothetical protein [Yersinia enterocolitica]